MTGPSITGSENGMPTSTASAPAAAAASLASVQPATESWSVMATTSSPAAAASSTKAEGRTVPSDMVEWVWRSMRTP